MAKLFKFAACFGAAIAAGFAVTLWLQIDGYDRLCHAKPLWTVCTDRRSYQSVTSTFAHALLYKDAETAKALSVEGLGPQIDEISKISLRRQLDCTLRNAVAGILAGAATALATLSQGTPQPLKLARFRHAGAISMWKSLSKYTCQILKDSGLSVKFLPSISASRALFMTIP